MKNLSFREIAQLLDIKESEVRSIYRTAMNKLNKDYLKELHIFLED